MKIGFLFFLFLFFPFFLYGQGNTKPPTPWMRLLYYQGSSSEVESAEFFLHPQGRFHPELEYQTEIQAMFPPSEEGINDEHPICLFPARFILLNRLLKKNQQSRLRHCQKLHDFIVRSQPRSVSLVFSSYYLHNPSSAFGHTLLKINRLDGDEQDLLGYGINYAAVVDTNNSLIYAFKGLAGLFKGEFAAIPYYYKVREYNDYESRDLWSYELELKPEELQLLIFHVWELGRAWSSYLYVTKNCSYWVLRVLEAVAPRLQLVEYLPGAYTIPVDTLRSLYKNKDLVKKVSLRPSIRTYVLHHFKKLNEAERIEVRDIAVALGEPKSKEKPVSLSDKPLKIIEATMDYFDFRYAKEIFDHEDVMLERKKPLLIERSHRPKSTKSQDLFFNKKPPHDFHPSSVFALNTRYQDSDTRAIDLVWKPALHDLLDPHTGFDPYSEINFFETRLQIYKEQQQRAQFHLREFNLVRISALTPSDSLSWNLAWKFSAGLNPLRYAQCFACNAGFVNLGTGFSFKLGRGLSPLVYILMNQKLEHSKRLGASTLRASVGPMLGIYAIWSDYFKSDIRMEQNFAYDLNSSWQHQPIFVQSHQYYFPNRSFALRLQTQHRHSVNDYSLSFRFFY